MRSLNVDRLDCSIVIPTWNAEAHIEAAIASALAQAPVTLEVIVVDDASHDATVARVVGLGDPRVKVIPRRENGGPGAARNLGFAAAKGRFIAVLDADDLMLPSRLGPLIAAADEGQLDVVADNMVVRTEGAESLHIKEDLDGSVEMISLEALFTEAILFRDGIQYGYLKPLFSRSFLQVHGLHYDESLRVGEDFQLLAECLAIGGRLGRVRTAGYIYERRSGSTSHRLKPGQLGAMAAADELFLSRFGPALSDGARRAVGRRRKSALDGEAFVIAVDALKARRFPAAVAALLKRPKAAGYFAIPIRDRLRRLRRGAK